MKFIFSFSLFFLFTTSLFAQIPNGYYDGTDDLEGEALVDALHDIIDNHDEYSYDDLRDFILSETDEDPDNSNNVILLYTGRSQPKSTFGGGADDWNREHVWAKSHGDFGNTPPAGTDAHHIRPTDASVNSSRGNLDFDNGGSQHPEATGCYFDSDSWEPRDEVKGDVARMIFYMEIRYDGSDGMPNLSVVDEVDTYPAPEHGKLSTLLEWHEQDPPDDFEMNRNEVIYSYQENRNPFIDHPEFVAKIWGDPTSVEQIEKKDIRVFPNPTRENLTVVLPDEGKKYMISVFSTQGKKLMKIRSNGQKQVQLETGGLTSGTYILNVTHQQKVVKGIPFSKN